MGESFQIFLAKQAILLKDFGPYVERTTEEVKAAARQLAEQAGRPYIYYLDAVVTKKKGLS